MLNNYQKENLVLFNMKRVKKDPYSMDSFKIFEIENTMSVDEKVAFIDSQTNGLASYAITLITKWLEDKDALPKDKYDKPKTVSRNAWVKRNDNKKIITTYSHKMKYHMCGVTFEELSLTCPTTEYGYNMVYSGQSVIHQWFHDLLVKLAYAEKKHFEENDPYSIKLEKIREFGRYHTTVFNSQELNDVIWNNKKDIHEEHLDVYIQAYEKLEQATKEIELEVHAKINTAKIEQ